MVLCLKRSNFFQVTRVSLFLWPFSTITIITHHLWYMALLIFRTFEAFYQNFHTSLGGTAAYNSRYHTVCTFEKYLGILFTESLMITEHLYLSSSLKEHSHVFKTWKHLLIIPKENMWLFPMLYFFCSRSAFSLCFLYVCSVSISCYHAVSLNI